MRTVLSRPLLNIFAFVLFCPTLAVAQLFVIEDWSDSQVVDHFQANQTITNKMVHSPAWAQWPQMLNHRRLQGAAIWSSETAGGFVRMPGQSATLFGRGVYSIDALSYTSHWSSRNYYNRTLLWLGLYDSNDTPEATITGTGDLILGVRVYNRQYQGNSPDPDDDDVFTVRWLDPDGVLQTINIYSGTDPVSDPADDPNTIAPPLRMPRDQNRAVAIPYTITLDIGPNTFSTWVEVEGTKVFESGPHAIAPNVSGYLGLGLQVYSAGQDPRLVIDNLSVDRYVPPGTVFTLR